ncbi:competence type IV pilus major pilin ComGC [Priestia abyssalis]|uniref:competence type IV pilus major pilin ComGC n=1 Tax=Priestia abyssalis TaxID=1221450 RepID=UPI002E25CD73
MNRCRLKKNGFTLIEMLVVMLVISILLLIMIPNLLKNNEAINGKGCEAYVKTVQAQVEVYKIENENDIPTIEELKNDAYIDAETCPNGDILQINDKGEVTSGPKTEEVPVG